VLATIFALTLLAIRHPALGWATSLAPKVSPVRATTTQGGSVSYTITVPSFFGLLRVPLWFVDGRLWCPLEQRYLRASSYVEGFS
jgi:hypothetical protein